MPKQPVYPVCLILGAHGTQGRVSTQGMVSIGGCANACFNVVSSAYRPKVTLLPVGEAVKALMDEYGVEVTFHGDNFLFDPEVLNKTGRASEILERLLPRVCANALGVTVRVVVLPIANYEGAGTIAPMAPEYEVLPGVV